MNYDLPVVEYDTVVKLNIALENLCAIKPRTKGTHVI